MIRKDGMRRLLSIEKKWTTTPLGAVALVAIFIAALWLAVFFLNELQWILKQEDIRVTQETYVRERLRFASGNTYRDSTPEKTMQGFIDALRVEDVDTALLFVARRFREEASAWFAQFESGGGDLSVLSEYIGGMQRRAGFLGGVEYYRPSLFDDRAESVIFIDQELDAQWRLTFSLH